MYLADTNVISAVAPRRGTPRDTPDIGVWLGAQGDRIWLSVITVAELTFGATDLRRRRQVQRSQQLEAWIEALVVRFAARLLPIDPGTAQRAGVLLARAVGSGRSPGMEDALIAATAERHGLIVLTRNTADFNALGVAQANPFDALPR